jgi:hypothetical protein
MFGIQKSNSENAVADEGFDGYIGLYPHLNHGTGLWDPYRPSLVTHMYNQGLIPAPIASIDICKDNSNCTSTITFGGYSLKGIALPTIFERAVPIQ